MIYKWGADFIGVFFPTGGGDFLGGEFWGVIFIGGNFADTFQYIFSVLRYHSDLVSNVLATFKL